MPDRDRFAGSADLNYATEYIKSKKIEVEGPYRDLEKVQITLHTSYELLRNYNHENLLKAWRIHAPDSVDLGIKLYQNHTLNKIIEKDENASYAFDLISLML